MVYDHSYITTDVSAKGNGIKYMVSIGDIGVCREWRYKEHLVSESPALSFNQLCVVDQMTRPF